MKRILTIHMPPTLVWLISPSLGSRVPGRVLERTATLSDVVGAPWCGLPNHLKWSNLSWVLAAKETKLPLYTYTYSILYSICAHVYIYVSSLCPNPKSRTSKWKVYAKRS